MSIRDFASSDTLSRSQFICPDITLDSGFAGRPLIDGASFDGKSVGDRDRDDVLRLLNSSDRIGKAVNIARCLTQFNFCLKSVSLRLNIL
ncbi:MAG: hypothetical protein V7K50_14360 [Nostoc sp.]|uniref:hypothetical protein n=1 Tax=Nostoc sp. TaxID=1180 RepID=UPI002FF50CC8